MKKIKSAERVRPLSTPAVSYWPENSSPKTKTGPGRPSEGKSKKKAKKRTEKQSRKEERKNFEKNQKKF